MVSERDQQDIRHGALGYSALSASRWRRCAYEGTRRGSQPTSLQSRPFGDAGGSYMETQSNPNADVHVTAWVTCMRIVRR